MGYVCTQRALFVSARRRLCLGSRRGRSPVARGAPPSGGRRCPGLRPRPPLARARALPRSGSHRALLRGRRDAGWPERIAGARGRPARARHNPEPPIAVGRVFLFPCRPALTPPSPPSSPPPSKTRGLGAGRKLKNHRRSQLWADKDYKKSHLGSEWRKPFAGASHAKGIVLEKM